VPSKEPGDENGRQLVMRIDKSIVNILPELMLRLNNETGDGKYRRSVRDLLGATNWQTAREEICDCWQKELHHIAPEIIIELFELSLRNNDEKKTRVISLPKPGADEDKKNLQEGRIFQTVSSDEPIIVQKNQFDSKTMIRFKSVFAFLQFGSKNFQE
jgi:hypothetical protein